MYPASDWSVVPRAIMDISARATSGSFVIGRKTIKKRMRAKLKAIKMELRKRMHDPVAQTGAWVKQMLQGHLNYFAVSGNHPSMWWYCNQVRWHWLRTLRRRSQKADLVT
jgi:RNA-directed DNA polymerase